MLTKISPSCNLVTNNAKHITVDYTVLDDLINTIKTDEIKYWLSSNPYDILSLDIEKLINFMLIFESIDYSFWGNPKWSIDTEEGKKDGSAALLYTLLNYVKNNDADFSKVSFEEFKNILNGNVEIPLLQERYNTVVEISKTVNQKMNGNFYEYIKDIKSDKELFNIIITNFPSFIDERTYNGETIYFYKLAQLLVSDITHLRNIIENIDIPNENLVACADYKIPQTLRALKIINYDEELSNIVDSKIEIEKNSIYEVEIRASMVSVINYISTKLPNINSIDINDYFFLLAKQVKDIVKPYHLCRNTNY